MKNYRDLDVWRRSHHLALQVYAITKDFPQEERFGLTSQLRRSAISVPANIAEGCGRDTDTELKRFLDIAHGSASETEYYFLLAAELGYLPGALQAGLADEVGQLKRMIGAFSRKLKADR